MKPIPFLFCSLFVTTLFSQADTGAYKKRVLEQAEIDLLFSYYGQDGDHAAVTGGEGTEELTDAGSTLVVSIPLNGDDVLSVDVGISAYTSASSSNVNPFDGRAGKRASPFSATSGASRQDALVHSRPTYSHSSEDRNTVLSVNGYVASEYDYFSLGGGVALTRFFNEANTEVSLGANVFFDAWRPQYPIELRSGFFDDRIMGTGTYAPLFEPFSDKKRNSYALSLGLVQVLGKRLQGGIFADFSIQKGLLSTPHQRVYLADRNDFFIEEFQLADDVERLPDTRKKYPVGARLNYFISDFLVFRGYYRFYNDDWGLQAHTASFELPIKINDQWLCYPMYRYYSQSAADYFYIKETALSTNVFYTSDYDLSKFTSHQYGVGVRYKDIFARARIWKFGLKAVDLRINKYDRSDGLNAFIVSLGTSFVAD